MTSARLAQNRPSFPSTPGCFQLCAGWPLLLAEPMEQPGEILDRKATDAFLLCNLVRGPCSRSGAERLNYRLSIVKSSPRNELARNGASLLEVNKAFTNNVRTIARLCPLTVEHVESHTVGYFPFLPSGARWRWHSNALFRRGSHLHAITYAQRPAPVRFAICERQRCVWQLITK